MVVAIDAEEAMKEARKDKWFKVKLFILGIKIRIRIIINKICQKKK